MWYWVCPMSRRWEEDTERKTAQEDPGNCLGLADQAPVFIVNCNIQYIAIDNLKLSNHHWSDTSRMPHTTRTLVNECLRISTGWSSQVLTRGNEMTSDVWSFCLLVCLSVYYIYIHINLGALRRSWAVGSASDLALIYSAGRISSRIRLFSRKFCFYEFISLLLSTKNSASTMKKYTFYPTKKEN